VWLLERGGDDVVARPSPSCGARLDRRGAVAHRAAPRPTRAGCCPLRLDPRVGVVDMLGRAGPVARQPVGRRLVGVFALAGGFESLRWVRLECWGAIAHDMLRWTQRIGVPDTTVRAPGMLRRRLLQLPARLTPCHGRSWTLHLPLRWPGTATWSPRWGESGRFLPQPDRCPKRSTTTSRPPPPMPTRHRSAVPLALNSPQGKCASSWCLKSAMTCSTVASSQCRASTMLAAVVRRHMTSTEQRARDSVVGR